MQSLYEKAARAAYYNSKSLLYEARLLARNSKFSRAYALCVLSTEEFCKAFLYKSVSAGLVGKHKVREIVLIHSEKIERFVHIILVPFVLSHHWKEIKSAIEHDKNEPNHANHVFPEVLDEIGRDVPRLVGRIQRIFGKAHALKLKALYVEVRGKKLIVPNEKVDEREYHRIERFVTGSIFGFETYLGTERNSEFRKIVVFFDPGLWHIFAPKVRS